jgi:hypothetical protein
MLLLLVVVVVVVVGEFDDYYYGFRVGVVGICTVPSRKSCNPTSNFEFL